MSNKQYSQLIFITKFMIVTFYLLLIILDIKHFSIWSQITTILSGTTFDDRMSTVIQLFSEHHPHALRISLIAPIYQIADILDCNVEMLYSIVVLFLFIFIYIVLTRILKNFEISSMFIGLFLVLFLLSFFMHGRIAFAMFGNSVMLYALFTKTYAKIPIGNIKFFFLIILSLWFTSVSSGTFMVSIGTIITFYSIQLLINIPYVKKTYIILFIALMILLVLLSPIIIQFINKNLDFYDGSFMHMLNHGAGKYILKYIYIIGIVVLILPFFLIVLFRFLKTDQRFILAISMIFTSLAIGLFGLSSLASGFPAYILFLYMIRAKHHSQVLYFV